MAVSDWTQYKIGFDSAGCNALIKKIYNVHLDVLSEKLINIVRGDIWLNGNGSFKVMRLFTVALVEELKREIASDHILLEVGIKMDQLPEDAFVRVSVVLHGNQASGPLVTKPGVATWGKHVIGHEVHVKAGEESYDLPEGFTKYDVIDEIKKNVDNNIQRHINDFMNAVAADVSRINWSAFITGGG